MSTNIQSDEVAARPDGQFVQRVRDAYRRIAEVDRPEVWITLRDEGETLAIAKELASRVREEGDTALPLAGTLLAVKDNIDVAGLPTTGGLPPNLREVTVSATAVSRLEAAGAIVIGKTNLDQLATGLVGTRSPYGIVRGAEDPELVSGGSSSGSAIAVALGIVDAALGTDTAGSGRIPAAFNGLVGIKPTLGLVPARGMMPAAPSYDTITVFARTLATAERVAGTMSGVDTLDPTSRSWEQSAPVSARPQARVAVPSAANLSVLSDSWADAFATTCGRLRDAGVDLYETDISVLLDAARLLYDGALVAERTYAVGALLTPLPDAADPSVAAIILGGADSTAVQLVSDQQTLRHAKLAASELFSGVDALLLPTAPGHPTIAAVLAEPIAVNSWVGTYTNFVNLLDLAALAVPAGRATSGHFGVTLVGPAFSDSALADFAARFFDVGPRDIVPRNGRAVGSDLSWSPPTTAIAVFGAHRTGHALSWQLADLGARALHTVVTAPDYLFYALKTDPPKPGLVHVTAEGASIEGELWAVPSGRVGDFLAQLVRPMTVGKVVLADGSEALGFLCEPDALQGAVDITGYGSWPRYRESL